VHTRKKLWLVTLSHSDTFKTFLAFYDDLFAKRIDHKITKYYQIIRENIWVSCKFEEGLYNLNLKKKLKYLLTMTLQ
jgi:hypothetical protein